jgi:hypothetical protein
MAIRILNNNYGGRVSISSRGLGGRFSYVADPIPLLLDLYSGAAAAYSLRKLTTSYTGSAIRIRRSSDNAETDIGFSGTILSTAAITSFCGPGSGFVTTWYDQSGNGKNAVQATTANQPRISNAGSVYLLNNIPAIYFNMTGGGLNLTSYFTGTAGTLFRVQKNDTDPPSSFAGAPIDNVGTYVANDTSYYPFTDGVIYEKFATSVRKNVGNLAYNLTSSSLFTVLSDTGVWDARYNGTQVYNTLTNTVGYATNQFASLGSSYRGLVSEIIVYTNNKLNVRTSIESNISNYYSLYPITVPTNPWTGSGTALLDLYPNADMAYSLRNLSSIYTGPLIRVRRSSDNLETDIYGISNGQLDENTLLTFAAASSLSIVKWYDQNNNTRDAIQFNNGSQPFIVESGSINKINSRPTIRFTGTSPLPVRTAFSGSVGTKIQVVRTYADPTGIYIGNVLNNVGTAGFSGHYPFSDGVIYDEFATTSRKTVGNPTPSLANLHVYEAVSDSNLFKSFINNSEIFTTATNTVGYNANPATVGDGYSGSISEVIVYQSNRSSSLSAINANINSYYTIY